VVAGALVGMVLANGIFTYGFTVLVDPIRDEFGASLAQVMNALTLGTFCGLLVGPVMGILIDRYSVRHLMTLGCLATAIGLYGVSTAQSIGVFTIGLGITMSLSMGMVSSMSGSAAVSRWFTVSRGRALGIASMGTSLGGVVVPALLTWWVELYGWRGALQNMAYTAALVVMPFIWMTIRNRPEDVGQFPEGISTEPVQTGDVPVRVLGMADIIRMQPFWLIGLSMGMVFASFASMTANLSPYAARLGTSEAEISTMIAVLAISGLVGKFVFGTAADKINLKHGLWAGHALLITAFAILLAEPPYAALLVASSCIGLSTGGLLPVWNAMVARIFGVESFGRAMGAMGPMITLSIMPAYMLIGYLFDTTGSYTQGLWVFSGVIGLAAVLLIPLKMENYQV
jgi:predicted MFS family arabinose efflux permease